MYRLKKMIQRDLLNLIFNPTWLVFCIFFPFSLIAIVGFMTQNLYGSNFSSYDYYGVTLMIYSALYTSIFAANSFMEEKIKKPNLRVVFAPVNEWEIPFSKIVATFLYTIIFYSIVGVCSAYLFKINFGKHIFLLWLLFAALNLFCSSLGVLMCCVFKSEAIANQILSLLTNVIAIASGLLFPAAVFGETLMRFSNFIPLSTVSLAAFKLIYDDNTAIFLPIFVGLISATILMTAIAQLLFKGEDYL